LLPLLLSAATVSPEAWTGARQAGVARSDVDSSNKAAKAIFEKYETKLIKAEWSPERQLLVYYVEFEWDPQTSPNARRLTRLETEVYRAGGQKDFAMQAAEDGIRIEVRWDKAKNALRETIIALQK
jgi:hypothetical protein